MAEQGLPAPGEAPFISVIIPVHGEEELLRRCLASLEALDYPKERMEVFLVDDGANPRTTQILEESGHRVLVSGGRGPSAARNLAIAEAKGEYLAFTDADCTVHRSWLRELSAPLLCGGGSVAGAGGSQEPPESDGAFAGRLGRFIGLLGVFLCSYTKPYGTVTQVSHNPSCNAIYRASVLRSAGGFREGLWPGEDLELDLRLVRSGHRLMYNPAAVVYHARPQSLPAFARMMYRYGCWAGGYLTRRFGFFRWMCWEPLLFFGLLLATLVLAVVSPLGGLAFFTAGCGAIWAYFFARTAQPLFSLFALWALLVTLLFWNAGFLRGLFVRLPDDGRAGP